MDELLNPYREEFEILINRIATECGFDVALGMLHVAEVQLDFALGVHIAKNTKGNSGV